jgi:hypothetical protein
MDKKTKSQFNEVQNNILLILYKIIEDDNNYKR